MYSLRLILYYTVTGNGNGNRKAYYNYENGVGKKIVGHSKLKL